MADDDFDPFRPTRNGQPSDVEVLKNFLDDFVRFMDEALHNPPDALRGSWLEEQADAWRNLNNQGLLTELKANLSAHHDEPTGAPARLPHAGLTGVPLRTKMNAWRRSVLDFLELRSIKRLARAGRTSGVILGSLADAVGFGHAYEEAATGLQHLCELALDDWN